MTLSRMDRTLPLHPAALTAAARPTVHAGDGASGGHLVAGTVERMLAAGLVRRLLRGVYVASTAPASVASARRGSGAAARAARCSGRPAAAWVHGALVLDPVPLDVLARRSVAPGWTPSSAGRDLVTLGGVRVTSPLGRRSTWAGCSRQARRWVSWMPWPARSASGAARRAASVRRPAGIGQLRTLAAQVDARSAGPAESVLRLHWNAANLPTPVPGIDSSPPGLAWSGRPWRSNSASSASYSPTRSRPPTSSPSKEPAGGSSYSPSSASSPPTPPSGPATSNASSTNSSSNKSATTRRSGEGAVVPDSSDRNAGVVCCFGCVLVRTNRS